MDHIIHLLFKANQSEITWWAMIFRGIVIYFLAIFIIRFGGKRILSRFGTFDVVISIIIGAILAKAIVGSAKFIPTIITSCVLVSIHFFLSKLTLYYHPLGHQVKGNPHLLYENGNFIDAALKKNNITHDDIIEAVRLQTQSESLENVDRIYLERNGQISFVLHS
ncbi:MAG: DUF421 domain-containing protein [Sporocytophaga sp.]|uniref:DUF421 domain-containing protein n=1 Tax=Sporocytophaga sp. TaxID=2231183 RepID=UPI001B1C9FE8|nr:YetF domain-containing protein [Sporocytophaga sp.]MBO9700482.1 DUF421 domain-containing protein [Sporocytophaga sp.]